MKTRISTLIMSLFVTMMAFADTYIDRIYYNLDWENKTAELAYPDSYLFATGGSGIVIPASVWYSKSVFSVTSIGDEAFYNCTPLKSITIPNSVTSIGDEAFYNCSSLIAITIPNSVTSIGERTFYNCSSLKYITIPNSVTSIGERTFYNCSSLPYIIIPNSATSIGYQAFYNCSSLTSITIGNSVTSIGEDAFGKCTSLTSIEVNANNQNYASIDGVLYNKDVTALICCPGGKTSITIPNSVTAIGYGAFSGSSNLTSITIPNSITFIGDYAFSSCDCLDTITCFAITPPDISSNTWSNYNSLLLVPECSLDAYKSHKVWGRFKNIKVFKEKYTISTSVNDEKMGVVLGDGIYEEGTEITLTATANVGYGFVKWSDGNIENPRTIVVTEDLNLTAEFAINQYNVEVTSIGNGLVNYVNGVYNHGDEITITATPNGNYHFVKWSDGNTENPRTIVVTEDLNLIAEFAINQYEVNVKADENGYVTGSGTYDYGTEVMIEAIANEGYRFVQWSDGNTENPRTIVVTEDVELRAEFEEDGKTLVDNVDESSVMIYVQNGVVYVEGAETDYHVLDAAGRLIYTGRDAQLSLPRGVYVVVVGDEVEKVVI